MCLYHPNGKLKVFQDIVISIANSAFISSDCTVFFSNSIIKHLLKLSLFSEFFDENSNSVVLLKNGF